MPKNNHVTLFNRIYVHVELFFNAKVEYIMSQYLVTLCKVIFNVYWSSIVWVTEFNIKLITIRETEREGRDSKHTAAY